MSDKLKIMQTHIGEGVGHVDKIDPYWASIGYPELKALPTDEEVRSGCDCDQPDLDESAFRDYVSKAELVACAETA
ncbi:MAG TPA: hypothetical protein EYN91_18350 [Candidatus Melainabacteria bacterium]|nr:hypothetical protein [Candidatus Melainabacteria bacterium]HIN63816.1 hypothetical protein [Candidatus Obscuribacterales bacterium]